MYCLDTAHVILRFKIGDACVATLLLLLVMVPGLLQLVKLAGAPQDYNFRMEMIFWPVPVLFETILVSSCHLNPKRNVRCISVALCAPLMGTKLNCC